MNEKNTETISVVALIEQIIDKREKFSFKKSGYDIFEPSLSALAEYLGTTRFQAVMFALFFHESLGNHQVTLSRVADILKSNILHIIPHFDEVKEMVALGLIEADYKGGQDFFDDDSSMNEYSDITYAVPQHVVKLVIENRKIEPGNNSFGNEDFLRLASTLFRRYRHDSISFEVLSKRIELKCQMKGTTFSESYEKLKKDYTNADMLSVIALSCAALEDETLSVTQLANHVTGSRNHHKYFVRSINDKTNMLVIDGLIEFVQSDLIVDKRVQLTEAGRKYFLAGLELDISIKNSIPEGFTDYKTIARKPLFFNPEDARQIEEIEDMLTEKKYKKIKANMKKLNMPAGVAILLHGAPGTGKTECVWQIARKTKRLVFMIDIASLKSSWFGESEKNIKNLFSKYRVYASKMKTTPILFFNEADAVLGKRKDTAMSSVATTENAIQNIILQEMENLNGIMIATTNLTNNLDSAFERRFLFKVMLSRPKPAVASRIWKSFFPHLPVNQLVELAVKHPFTGAQIENIARRALVAEIRSGKKASLDVISDICSHEKIESGAKRIGF